MKKKIVTIVDNKGRAGTVLIAEGFNRRHEQIVRLIKKYQKKFEEINPLKRRVIEGATKSFREYLLTYDQLLLLITLMKNKEDIVALKSKMIRASSIITAIDLIKSFDFNDSELRYVYAAVDSQKRVKIGISNNPQERIKNLNIGNADKLELIFTKKSNGVGYSSEIELHKKCKPFFIRSEWFTEKALEVLK